MSEAPSQNNLPLFRVEARHRGTALNTGAVQNLYTAQHQMLSILTFILLVGTLLFIYFGQYTRKAVVTGVISPVKPTAHASSPTAAIVKEIRVKEGDIVEEGQILFTLMTDIISSSGRGHTNIELTITKQIATQETKKRETQSQLANELSQLGSKNDNLTNQRNTISNEINITRELLQSKSNGLKRLEALHKEKLVPTRAFDEAFQQLLMTKIEMNRLLRLRQDLDSRLADILYTTNEIKYRAKVDLAGIDNNILTLSREKLSNEAAQFIYIASPFSGTVTAINTSEGQHISPGTLLSSITPNEVSMEAVLYIPSEDIGFVEVGQTTTLRMTAFPYQKFGSMHTTITKISKSPYQGKDIAPNFQEMLDSNKNYYKATATITLDDSAERANKIKTSPGLTFQADISLETRTFYEWMLHPILSFSNK